MPDSIEAQTNQKKDSYSSWGIWALLGFGVVLYLRQYLFNRSLWLDEAYLASNVLNRSYSELLQPLEYKQAAPAGFLWMSKLMTQLFGEQDYSLRLFPLLAAIGGLFLFPRVARHYLKPPALAIGLGLYVVSNSLIYYASEFKQYSTDVFSTLLIFYVVLENTKNSKISLSGMLWMSMTGMAAILFSYPALFSLAGTGLCLLLEAGYRKEMDRFRRLALVCFIWGIFFVIIYLSLIQHLNHNTSLNSSWKEMFMPFPPVNWNQLMWYPKTFFNMFKEPYDFSWAGIASLFFIAGCVFLWRVCRKDFWMLMAPFFLTLMAAGLNFYPFGERLILFTLPLTLIILAQGADFIRGRLLASGEKALCWLLLGALFYAPALLAAEHFFVPRVNEEIKPVMKYIRTNWKKGDQIFLYHYAIPAFSFYKNEYGFRRRDYIKGRGTRNKEYITVLRELCGHKRLWVVFSHFKTEKGPFDEMLYLDYLDVLGRRTGELIAPEASAYLYDLSNPQTCPGFAVSES